MKKEIIKKEVKVEKDKEVKVKKETNNKFPNVNKVIRKKQRYMHTSKYLEDEYNVN
jgi:hypothetical protein